MILEEYLDGDEFDVDVLFSDGNAVYCNVVDIHPVFEPWCQEYGGRFPSAYPEGKQQEMRYLAIEAGSALGYVSGVICVEMLWTSCGPRAIEVNGRTPCGANTLFHQQAWGVDLVESHVLALLGIPLKPCIPSKPKCCLMSAETTAPYSGVMNSEDWLNGIRYHENVFLLRYLKKKGDIVVGPEDGVPTNLVRLIFKADYMASIPPLVTEIFREDIDASMTPKNSVRRPFKVHFRG